jgi:hypothetical protein
MATVALTYTRPWERGVQPAAAVEASALPAGGDALVIDSIAGSVRPEEVEPMTPGDPYIAPGSQWDDPSPTRGESGNAATSGVGGGTAEPRDARTAQPAPATGTDRAPTSTTIDSRGDPRQQEAEPAPVPQQPRTQQPPQSQLPATQQPAPTQSQMPPVAPMVEPVTAPTVTTPPGDQRQVRTDTGAPRVLNPPDGR